ncbi:MAG: hypothetical protein IPN09_02160 [Bacteroidetes bacterium]|nr:hypothetical protein [Bacteroidota bacterium]
MNEDKFINVVRTIKEYAEALISESYYHPNRIQLHKYSKEGNEYGYVTDKTRKLSYLQYLLHGAINKVNNNSEFEDSIKNYIIHELKLLWGCISLWIQVK